MARFSGRSKSLPLLGLAATALTAFGLACSQPGGGAGGTGSTASGSTMTLADSIELGRHLSIIGGCNDCHTPGLLYGAPDTTRLLSGSELGWAGPWGVSYPRNLTPDVETGLGSWSSDDIVKALRTGQRPDGSPLLPPMPWPNYARLTDLEIHSLVAYLKSIPPVKHAMPKQIPPGQPVTGAALVFPAPPAWDVQPPPKPAG
jgi:mono/diheme cytochrome c family protein